MLLGSAGVVCFSLTLPATSLAESSFSAPTVGVGRSVLGAGIAILVLLEQRERLLPPRAALSRLLLVALNAGIGFGLLSALALRQVSSVHGAVLTGLIPAATAGMAVVRAGERPRSAYWGALALGLAAVIGFALIQGGGSLRVGDILLLAAIAVAGIGYAEGGALAREYGGWRVICWALILALPVSLPVTAVALAVSPPQHITAKAAAGLAYVGIFSVCIGFFAWYAGMARGGVARIGRLQLAQPALTLLWSVLLLGESVSWLTGAAAAAVIAATAVGRNARVDNPAERSADQAALTELTPARSP